MQDYERAHALFMRFRDAIARPLWSIARLDYEFGSSAASYDVTKTNRLGAQWIDSLFGREGLIAGILLQATPDRHDRSGSTSWIFTFPR